MPTSSPGATAPASASASRPFPVPRGARSSGSPGRPGAARRSACWRSRDASGRPEHPGVRRRRGPIAWTWTLLVALVSVRDELISCGLTSRGIAVVCDRWTCDALVDLELRYGRHRLAEWLLRRATPPADVELVLEIDAETAARRKPGDQPPAVLDRMPALYEQAARSTGARRID